MALSEFVAMETAYRALQQLDPAARQRALRWLTDALGGTDVQTETPAEDDTAVPAAAATPAPRANGGGETPRRQAPRRESNGKTEAVPAATARTVRTGRGGRRAAAPSAPPRTRRGRAAVVAESTGGERVYRRMPPPEVVLAAYRQVGTVSGLAEHFGVPRHTVQGWARRLRRAGYEIGRGA